MINKDINEPLFQKGVRGYSHVNKSIFIKQPDSSVKPYTIVRKLIDEYAGLNTTINFTSIDSSLYLDTNQLIDLFGTDEKRIRDHMSNIYGEFLERNGLFTMNDVQSWGGRISPPPIFLTIYRINVVYKRTENNINQHGGGGGSQQVLFYHHDTIIELANRLNNDKARAICRYVKNTIHEYHKNGLIVNTNQHADIYSVFITLLKRYKNYTTGRLLNIIFIRGKIDQLFNMCHDRHLFNRGYFHGNIRNTLTVYATGKNAAGIIYSCSNRDTYEAGTTSHAGISPTKQDVCIGVNYLSVGEESYYGGAINIIFGDVLNFSNNIKINNNGLLGVRDVLRFSVFSLAGHKNGNIDYVSGDFHDYPITAIPKIFIPINMSKAKRIAIENLIHVRNNFEKKVYLKQSVTENELIDYIAAGDELAIELLEENDYVEQLVMDEQNNINSLI